MWDRIKKYISDIPLNLYVSNGVKYKTLMKNNKNYINRTLNRIINEYEYGTIDELEAIKQTNLAIDKHSSHIRYRIKDVINSYRLYIQSKSNKLKEYFGVNKGYIYEAKLEACSICKPKHGKKWKKWADIEPKDTPLIHFGCRCHISSITEDGNGYDELLHMDSKSFINNQNKEIRDTILKRRGLSVNEIFKKRLSITYDRFKYLIGLQNN